jgi:antitoxin (DNA-binding transcriptional repressor) of toxin-antitoxin stability system
MKKMTVKKFKTNCARILDKIRETREPVYICQGKTILFKVTPYRVPRERLFGTLSGKMKIVGDILSPLWLAEEEADRKQRRKEKMASRFGGR